MEVWHLWQNTYLSTGLFRSVIAFTTWKLKNWTFLWNKLFTLLCGLRNFGAITMSLFCIINVAHLLAECGNVKIWLKLKLLQNIGRYYTPLSSQGHIGTGPKHCHVWELNPHKGDNLWLDAKCANPLVHRGSLVIKWMQFSSTVKIPHLIIKLP